MWKVCAWVAVCVYNRWDLLANFSSFILLQYTPNKWCSIEYKNDKLCYIMHFILFILYDDNIQTYNSRDIQVFQTMYNSIVVMNKAGGLFNHMDQVSLVKVN